MNIKKRGDLEKRREEMRRKLYFDDEKTHIFSHWRKIKGKTATRKRSNVRDYKELHTKGILYMLQ